MFQDWHWGRDQVHGLAFKLASDLTSERNIRAKTSKEILSQIVLHTQSIEVFQTQTSLPNLFHDITIFVR